VRASFINTAIGTVHLVFLFTFNLNSAFDRRFLGEVYSCSAESGDRQPVKLCV